MKRITKEELPETLTEGEINILIEMGMEFPQSKEWHDIFDYLIENNLPILRKILDEVGERKKIIEQVKEETKSEEQKRLEAEHNKKAYENLDPNGFYGNMGQPTGVYDYKDR